MIQGLLFYFFSAILLGSSAMVVFSERPVKAALFLVLSFVSASALWLLQYAEFLALALIFVYVGAVMTLFLFVVMMINVDHLPTALKPLHRLGLGVLVFFGALILGAVYVYQHPQAVIEFTQMSSGATGSNSLALGKVIYTEYAVAFQMVALILLVAMISAIVLVFRGRRQGSKSQVVRAQVSASKASRLRIIKGDQ